MYRSVLPAIEIAICDLWFIDLINILESHDLWSICLYEL